MGIVTNSELSIHNIVYGVRDMKLRKGIWYKIGDLVVKILYTYYYPEMETYSIIYKKNNQKYMVYLNKEAIDDLDVREATNDEVMVELI